jgi:hypothetical protein
MTPMTLFCKSLILNKTDNNHSYLLFDIFYKKIYELVVCGAPGGRAADGTRKG